MQLNYDKLLEKISESSPYLLLDKVLSFSEGESITAIKNVTGTERYFTGHFPELAIMPGVLIIESLIQAGSILVNPLGDYKQIHKLSRFRFTKSVHPGDQLELRAVVKKKEQHKILLKANAMVEGKEVAGGKIEFEC